MQSLIFGWLQEPDISLDGLTQALQRRNVSISASGVSQRFSPEAATLLQRVLERLCEQHMQLEAVEIAMLQQFTAVVIEDSSSIALPDGLAPLWQGWEGKGKCAAVKLFVRWDVLRGRLKGPELCDCDGRRNDRRSPLALEELPEGCQYVADLGFYGLQRFCTLAGRTDSQRCRAKRYFVSRWQPRTVLCTRQGHRLELRGLLPQQLGQRVELGVILMQQGRCLPVRLLIERVPQEVAEQRQEQLREAARHQGRAVGEGVLYLSNWTTVLTNVPRKRLTAEQVLVILRLRWQIEWLFRLWKQYGKIDE